MQETLPLSGVSNCAHARRAPVIFHLQRMPFRGVRSRNYCGEPSSGANSCSESRGPRRCRGVPRQGVHSIPSALPSQARWPRLSSPSSRLLPRLSQIDGNPVRSQWTRTPIGMRLRCLRSHQASRWLRGPPPGPEEVNFPRAIRDGGLLVRCWMGLMRRRLLWVRRAGNFHEEASIHSVAADVPEGRHGERLGLVGFA